MIAKKVYDDNMITPHENQPALAEALGLAGLCFKREDLHPYGSHKGRSIPVMIQSYAAAGDERFAITGSGNAALAAALYVREYNAAAKGPALSLDIFAGNHISSAKLAKLKNLGDDHIRVLIKERPLQALTEAVKEGARSLRQSTDDAALVGYASLAEELAEIPDLGAVFVGTSSGTTAQALAAYFKDKKLSIQVHIVQTASCHPMAQEFEAFDGIDEISLADAIVDKTALRKKALIPLIHDTGGYGWVASNDDIETAQELADKHAGLAISTNSALSVVGAMKAGYLGYEIEGTVACLICGD